MCKIRFLSYVCICWIKILTQCVMAACHLKSIKSKIHHLLLSLVSVLFASQILRFVWCVYVYVCVCVCVYVCACVYVRVCVCVHVRVTATHLMERTSHSVTQTYYCIPLYIPRTTLSTHWQSPTSTLGQNQKFQRHSYLAQLTCSFSNTKTRWPKSITPIPERFWMNGLQQLVSWHPNPHHDQQASYHGEEVKNHSRLHIYRYALKYMHVAFMIIIILLTFSCLQHYSFKLNKQYILSTSAAHSHTV